MLGTKSVGGGRLPRLTEVCVTSGTIYTGTISPALPNAVSTKVEPEFATFCPSFVSQRAWETFTDRTFIEWGRDPSQLGDEGIESPRPETIRRAILFALSLKDQGLPAPDSIVPDPNGGIVFQRRAGDISESFHFWDDGSVEYVRLQGHRLLDRKNIMVD
jgi:hypothetical protein